MFSAPVPPAHGLWYAQMSGHPSIPKLTHHHSVAWASVPLVLISPLRRVLGQNAPVMLVLALPRPRSGCLFLPGHGIHNAIVFNIEDRDRGRDRWTTADSDRVR